MKHSIVAIAMLAATVAGTGCVDAAEAQAAGGSPAGWVCGSTGGGSPNWTLEPDPSGIQVLKQSGSGPFPWCVKPQTKLADGFVEVKFKPLGGREDQAGGIVWRWKNGNDYYVARANALENNVSLYYTTAGSRHTIRYVDAPVTANVWHRLRVEFAGTHIMVWLDGTRYIDADDAHIAGPGSVGVWTKADSVTMFDEFRSGQVEGKKP